MKILGKTLFLEVCSAGNIKLLEQILLNKLRYKKLQGCDMSGASQLRYNFSNKMSFAVLELDWGRRPKARHRGPNLVLNCIKVNMKSDGFLFKR